MKDYILIEGKEYISSRRAAEITKYSQDYIGQLSRRGLIDARQVGRAWVVERNSIVNHLEHFSKNNNQENLKVKNISVIPVQTGILSNDKVSNVDTSKVIFESSVEQDSHFRGNDKKSGNDKIDRGDDKITSVVVGGADQ